ncbi:MAG TPA: glycosyltransferase 87 family protein [Actinomycetota bacterium]|nr:glycosyltransferase 87 family protein [Actinomycetota bacterium]
MKAPGTARAVGTLSLTAVLAATIAVLALGLLQKAPCATGNWSDGRQYRRLCYTDLVPLYHTERMNTGRLPYLDPCPERAAACDEYPVLTMYFMRLSGWLSGNSSGSFFVVNAALLAVLAVAAATFLYQMTSTRALYFALAPTLLVYAFINWDLLAIVLATGATFTFFRGRDRATGILLGLGTAAKLYPALLVLPFCQARWKNGEKRRAGEIAAWAVGAWALTNVPFAVAAGESWATFFTLNSDRPPDYTSLWYAACHRITDNTTCVWSPHLINGLSLVAFAAVAAVAWWARRRRTPDFPRWTLAFALIVAFLLTNKVYSAQYSLWLLPWFALALPNVRLFVAFEITDIAVFVTQFSWFGTLSRDQGVPGFDGFTGPSLGALELALVARSLVLVACLVAWVRTRDEPAQPLRLESGGVAPPYRSRTASGTR